MQTCNKRQNLHVADYQAGYCSLSVKTYKKMNTVKICRSATMISLIFSQTHSITTVRLVSNCIPMTSGFY